MTKIKCNRGHYFDPEKHTFCPHCGVDIEDFEYTSYRNNTSPTSGVNQIGKTMPRIEPQAQRDLKTVAVGITNDGDVEKVIGWLICTSGTHIGKDFKLYSGRNKIGRDSSNDVVLPLDETISRSEHANVIYDPNGNQYYITPGSGRGLAYLNDQLVITQAIIKSYDRIKLGSSEMLFVGLCNDEFKWE